MKYIETTIPGVWIIEPLVYNDARGYFMETFKQAEFENRIGEIRFEQENESCSTQGVIRGLHYQLEPYSQAKLVRVIQGRVLDVAVDLRRGSPTFGRYVAVELSAENKQQLYVPRGFAHGFHVMSWKAIFTYKVDRPYAPEHERGLRFDDPAVGIDWKIAAKDARISEKDARLPLLNEAEMNFQYNK
jgi:dTDP-4-dehydrorhamnose 3,5-epimerase